MYIFLQNIFKNSQLFNYNDKHFIYYTTLCRQINRSRFSISEIVEFVSIHLYTIDNFLQFRLPEKLNHAIP